jgi:hypothetical protein
MLGLAVERGVGLGEEFIEGFDGLNVRPVIDELPDGMRLASSAMPPK